MYTMRRQPTGHVATCTEFAEDYERDSVRLIVGTHGGSGYPQNVPLTVEAAREVARDLLRCCREIRQRERERELEKDGTADA